jgi:hypothetical protein
MLFSFPARTERSRSFFAFFGNTEKFRYIHAQCGSEFVQQIHADAKRSPLDITDLSAVDVCIHGKRILAQASSTADAAQIPSYSGATLHRPQAINLKQNKPSEISDTIKSEVVHLSWGRHMQRRVKWFCLALAASGLALSASVIAQDDRDPVSALGQYQGWWSFGGSPEACAIPGPDSGKVAIGRYDMSSGEPVFGSGTPKLGLWDASCELYQPEFIEGKIEAISVCTGEEGEQSVGRTTFLGSDDQIEVRSPLGIFELQRCPTGQESSATSPAILPPKQTDTGTVSPGLTPSAQSTAIAAVYRDYCQPAFGVDGPIDQTIYQRYLNQFQAAYRLDCDQFYLQAVTGVVAERYVGALLFLPNSPSQLDQAGGYAAGIELFLDQNNEVNTCLGNQEADILSRMYGGLPPKLLELATAADFPNITEGYRAALANWSQGKMQRVMSACEAGLTYLSTSIAVTMYATKNVSRRP